MSYENSDHWWSWADKHIFSKIEGELKTGDDAFVYHLGFDELYRNVEVARDLNITATERTDVTVTLNVYRIFTDGSGQNIDFITDPVSQSFDNMPLAERVANNFAQAFE